MLLRPGIERRPMTAAELGPPTVIGPKRARGHRLRHGVGVRLRTAVGGTARLRVIILMASVLALDSADKATIGATAAQLEQALHIGNTQIGLLVTVSTGIGAIATLPIGALTDRINRVHLLTGAIVVWSAAMLLSGASQSYSMLLITRLALGAVIATAAPVVASLTGDLFPAAERGRIYGFILTGELIGTGIGFLVSGDIAAVLSWRYAFWILAVPGFILALAIRRLLPEPARGGQSRLQPGAAEIVTAEHPEPNGQEKNREEPDLDQVALEVREQGITPHEHLVLHEDPGSRSLWWALRYVLSIRTNVVLIVSSALGYFFYSGLQTFAVVFLQDRFGIGQGLASTLLVVLGAGAIVGVLATGRLGDALLKRHHLAARPIIAGISFLVAAVLFLPALLTTSLLVAAPLLFLAAAGLGGANPPLDAARLDLIHSPTVGASRISAHRAALNRRSDRPPGLRLCLHPIRGPHQRPRQPHRKRRTPRHRPGPRLPDHAHPPHRLRPAATALGATDLPPRRRHRHHLPERHPTPAELTHPNEPRT